MTARFLWLAAALAAALALAAAGAEAAQTNVQKCRLGRLKAKAKYTACVEKVVTLDDDTSAEDDKLFKCRKKYVASYAKLQKLSGSSCAYPRFVDTGDGTVIDNLTGLQWEKKADDTTIHDVGDIYQWSATGTAANGTAFGLFLVALNTACFAGHCDWRLPTLAELETLFLPEQPPCSSTPCIEPSLLPSSEDSCYWSTSDAFGEPDRAWDVCYVGTNGARNITKDLEGAVRAVRGGL